MKYLLGILILLFGIQLNGQVSPLDELGNYINNTLPEKVYIHTDKDVYATGENLWCAIYLLNGVSHAPGTFSEVVYVEFHDSEENIIYEKKIYAPEGHAAADFRLSGDLYPGTYNIIAYTNYQLNSPHEFIFQKRITVIDGPEPTEVVFDKKRNLKNLRVFKKEKFRFFPEGGNCINGVPCQVSVVSEDKITALGSIKDNNGKEVGKLNLKEGIGRFIYLPTEGSMYSLELNKLKYPISITALNDGFHLSVKKQKENLRITVSTNSDKSVKGANVVLHVRGDAILNKTLVKDGPAEVLYLPFDLLPSGVNTITIFDKNNEPMAERLYFVPIKHDTNLHLSLEEEELGKRKTVAVNFLAPLNLEFQDSLNVSRISYSVLPEKIFTNTSSYDIRTWLLLNSDLDEHIDLDPTLLFGDNPKATLRKVDDFLLTRAWRRFAWKSEACNDEYAPSHKIELGLYVQGYMTKIENSKKRQTGKVFMTNMKAGFIEETITDDNGNFVFGPYLAYDTSMAMVQGRYSKKSDDNREAITIDDKAFVDIVMSPKSKPEIERGPTLNMVSSEPTIDIESYKKLSDKYLDVAQSYDSLSITLDEVVFTSTFKSKVQQEREDRANIMGFKTPNYRMIVDSLGYDTNGRTLLNLFRQLPGFSVRGSTGNYEIIGRGSNSFISASSSPLLVLDGFPTELALLENYLAQNIDFIDVVNGIQAAARFGPDAINGAIMVYTKTGSESGITRKPAPGMINTEILGFYKAREFATFDSDAVSNQTRPDFRTTLYWNPDVRTDIKGKAMDSFTTSDQDGMYIIFAQGMRSDGIPISGTAKFKVDGSLQ